MREFNQDREYEEKLTSSTPINLFLGILIVMFIVALTLPSRKEENKLFKACYNACKLEVEEDISFNGVEPSFFVTSAILRMIGKCVNECEENGYEKKSDNSSH